LTVTGLSCVLGFLGTLPAFSLSIITFPPPVFSGTFLLIFWFNPPRFDLYQVLLFCSLYHLFLYPLLRERSSVPPLFLGSFFNLILFVAFGSPPTCFLTFRPIPLRYFPFFNPSLLLEFLFVAPPWLFPHFSPRTYRPIFFFTHPLTYITPLRPLCWW